MSIVKNKQYIIAGFIGLILTLLSFYIHILPSSNSMINFKTSIYNTEKEVFSNEYIQAVVDYHKKHPVFARRPLTTFLIETITNYTPLTIAQVFSLVNFFFIFLSGFLVFYLALLLKLNFKEALLSLILYHISFTILFPFFRTIYTYDEPLQYFAALFSILAILKNKKLLLIISLFVVLLARESSVIIFPSLLFLYHLKDANSLKINIQTIKKSIYFILPIGFYLIYYFIHTAYFNNTFKNYNELAVRFSQLAYNFQNINYTIESISVFVMIFLLPLSLLLYQKNDLKNQNQKNILYSFWLLLILNTIMVYVAARVSESRVLTLPLIFLWPILGKFALQFINALKLNLKSVLISMLISIIFTWLVGYKLAMQIYQPTGAESSENWFNEYFLMVIIISVFIITFNIIQQVKKSMIISQ